MHPKLIQFKNESKWTNLELRTETSWADNLISK